MISMLSFLGKVEAPSHLVTLIWPKCAQLGGKMDKKDWFCLGVVVGIILGGGSSIYCYFANCFGNVGSPMSSKVRSLFPLSFEGVDITGRVKERRSLSYTY